jgi:hypothetical protein
MITWKKEKILGDMLTSLCLIDTQNYKFWIMHDNAWNEDEKEITIENYLRMLEND